MLRAFNISIYFIIDPECGNGRNVVDVTREALAGGVSMVQYRNKSDHECIVREQAIALKALIDEWNAKHLAKHDLPVRFLINDYVELAAEIDADGVHIGQGDMDPKTARTIIGKDKILGLTAFTEDHIIAVDPDIVDYIGTGPVYPTKTDKGKPVLGVERFAELVKLSPVPLVGIGGITPQNSKPVMDAGANGVAMMRAISAAHDPKEAASTFLKILL